MAEFKFFPNKSIRHTTNGKARESGLRVCLWHDSVKREPPGMPGLQIITKTGTVTGLVFSSRAEAREVAIALLLVSDSDVNGVIAKPRSTEKVDT